MASDLAAQAAAVRARHQVLRSVPGSGFHDNDTSSPQRAGRPAVDAHVIAFAGKWETVLVGDDATRVVRELGAFAGEHKAAMADEGADPTLKAAVRAAREYAAADPAGGKLTVRNQQWNDVLYALDRRGVGVTVTAAA